MCIRWILDTVWTPESIPCNIVVRLLLIRGHKDWYILRSRLPWKGRPQSAMKMGTCFCPIFTIYIIYNIGSLMGQAIGNFVNFFCSIEMTVITWFAPPHLRRSFENQITMIILFNIRSKTLLEDIQVLKIPLYFKSRWNQLDGRRFVHSS